MKDFLSAEEALGVHFKDKEFLKRALTHKSYLNECNGSSQENNERLEFLGDAVLELVVSDYLYRNFQKPEGEMTNLRAALVNSNSLFDVAKNLKLKDYVLLSIGEARDTGRARASILANTLEAIIGAIYLDQGIEKAGQFIKNNILSRLPDILNGKHIKDPKSRFQEFAQEKFSITPDYNVIKEWGPDHKRQFSIGVYLGEKLVTDGQGFSKQEAESAAAQKALQILKN